MHRAMIRAKSGGERLKIDATEWRQPDRRK
jgi:hypothetical protein